MTRTDDPDRIAIEELHERDMRASRAGDFEALRSLISDAAVVMAPGQKRTSGKSEIDAAFEQRAAGPKTHEVLSYVQEFEEVEILGSLAYEWGTIRGSMRDLADDSVVSSQYHVMRILRKETDGAWRVFRTIWAPSG